MSNSKEKTKKKLSPITWILIGLLAFMAILITFMTVAVSKITARNAQSNMETVAKERAKVIVDYVHWAEDTLDNFSHASDIKNYLLDQENTDCYKAAQKYTQEFGAEVSDLEGLYICDWNAKTLTHINPDTIGVVIREGDRLAQLRDAFEAADDDIYNAGILISPNSGNQVVSIYKAIYDGRTPIGFVGLAIKTENVLSDIADMNIGGLQSSTYDLINAKDNIYLYSEDKSLIGTVCEVPDIQNINSELVSSTEDVTSYGEFPDATGKKMASVSDYISEYGWTLFVNAPSKEVYSMRNQLQIFILIFGILIILLVAVFGLINAHQESINRKLGNQLLKNEATEASLQTALFNDILTEVKNRVAFGEDLDKMQADEKHPCYFAMFDISELAAINTHFGNDAGDVVLCNTAAALTKAFPDGTVYRTGDDEFVVAVRKEDASTVAHNQVVNEVKNAQRDLFEPQETPIGMINVGYKIGLVRTTNEPSTNVVSVLKEMVNISGRSTLGQVEFVDMDSM
ncbi:MAG: diguanylate cyclase [Ruminococcus sp.]|uniref:sensor domain-containing diguanylate cyclase n=1 Tax=Ruminococcus sp. TaxID=41978 RepID=UPI0025EF9812|nr:diguanylate cyclase [Ruminococcus sp.]MCR5600361.1 diguanylate cyclase [Ruminococcus sp.]